MRGSPWAPAPFPGSGWYRGPFSAAEGSSGCLTREGKLEMTSRLRAEFPARRPPAFWGRRNGSWRLLCPAKSSVVAQERE